MNEWTDEQLRLIAFNIATQYLVDKSAGKGTPMTQLIEGKMIKMRDDLQARIAELERRLAEAQRWPPTNRQPPRYGPRTVSRASKRHAPPGAYPGRKTNMIKPLMKPGRAANGAQRDHGTLVHAVDTQWDWGSYEPALCGTRPGRRTPGWVEPYNGGQVTCPKCLKKLAQTQAA